MSAEIQLAKDILTLFATFWNDSSSNAYGQNRIKNQQPLSI